MIQDKKCHVLDNTLLEKKILEVFPQEKGTRLDLFLTKNLQSLFSRSHIQNMIRKGCVHINGTVFYKISYEVKEKDIISVAWNKKKSSPELQPENISLDILFKDQDLMVINKPAGLTVHPGAGNSSGTLVNALIHHCGNTLSQKEQAHRPGIVHRLDKNTSGAMLIALNDHTHEQLKKAFTNHSAPKKIERIYHALVWNTPSQNSGTINAPLGRARNRLKRAVVNPQQKDARHAITHFRVCHTFSLGKQSDLDIALIECSLETGRTHQIRVHMAHIGHPIVGDPDYCKNSHFKLKIRKIADPLKTILEKFSRQALHAKFLRFEHPQTSTFMSLEAPLPDDMENMLQALENNQKD